MPYRAGDVGPGRIIKDVLSGVRPLLTRNGPPRGELVSKASINDLHWTYKQAVRREKGDTLLGGRQPRVMTYHSFYSYFRFAVYLGLVVEVGQEPMDPGLPTLVTMADVTVSERMVGETPQQQGAKVVVESPAEAIAAAYDKLSGYKRPNSVAAGGVLDRLEMEKEVDVENARTALDDYREIDRSEYESADDYSEARGEAWSEFIEAVEGLSEQYEEETAEEEASPPPPPQVTVTPAVEVSGRVVRSTRRLYALTPQGVAETEAWKHLSSSY